MTHHARWFWVFDNANLYYAER